MAPVKLDCNGDCRLRACNGWEGAELLLRGEGPWMKASD